jgi:hypothetical protein
MLFLSFSGGGFGEAGAAAFLIVSFQGLIQGKGWIGVSYCCKMNCLEI